MDAARKLGEARVIASHGGRGQEGRAASALLGSEESIVDH
jgi:hypothetical protein